MKNPGASHKEDGDNGYVPVSEEQNAFDECWKVYRACREVCENGRLSALDASAFSPGSYRPDKKARAEDFLADFAKAGEKALEGTEWASRLILFRMYHLGLAHYGSARRMLGISELSWVQWSEQVRAKVGGELLRRRIHPAAKYFE